MIAQHLPIQTVRKFIPEAVLGETYLVSFPAFKLLAVGADIEAARAVISSPTATIVAVGKSEG